MRQLREHIHRQIFLEMAVYVAVDLRDHLIALYASLCFQKLKNLMQQVREIILHLKSARKIMEFQKP